MWFRLLSLALTLTISFVPGQRAWAVDSGQPEITSAAQLRALIPEEAGRGKPCLLRGTVLGKVEPYGRSFVLADATDEVYVMADPALVSALSAGDVIELRGQSSAGGYAPIVLASELTIIGRALLPGPRPVTTEELFSNGLDAEWVSFTGVVHEVRPFRPEEIPATSRRNNAKGAPIERYMFTIAVGDRALQVQVFEPYDPSQWTDCEVEVIGLCFNRHNSNRQFLGPHVLVPPGITLRLLQAAPRDPYESPPVAIGSLFQFNPAGMSPHRVRVKGTVLHSEEGNGFWLRDQHRAAFIQSNVSPLPSIGDIVDVVGFPKRGATSPLIAYGEFRRQGHVSPPTPHPLVFDETTANLDADLVEAGGLLTDIRLDQARVLLKIESNNKIISAITRDSHETIRHLEPGTTVMVRGIAAISLSGAGPVSGVAIPDTYHILTRNEADVIVIQRPSFWLGRRGTWTLAITAGVLALGSATILALARTRLRRMQRLRALEASEYHLRLTERTNMARDIHDTVAQSLGAISLQLELLGATRPESPGASNDHLLFAQQIVRTALSEVRGFIKNLRETTLVELDLPAAVRTSLNEATEGHNIETTLKIEGENRKLRPSIENQCFRIAGEAILNAVRHAEATTLRVTLDYQVRELILTIRDDGRGFPTHQNWTERGHYGLAGMEERAALLGGRLEITSISGSGTTVTACFPIDPPSTTTL